MGVSRLAHQNEIGKHQTQQVLKQPERRENQERESLEQGQSSQKQNSRIMLLKDRITVL